MATRLVVRFYKIGWVREARFYRHYFSRNYKQPEHLLGFNKQCRCGKEF